MAGGLRQVTLRHWAALVEQCWTCGVRIGQFLEAPHLNQERTDNTPDNLAILCPTCRRMHGVGVLETQTVRVARDGLLAGTYHTNVAALHQAFTDRLHAADWSLLQKGA
jgi:hypothetical protein